MGLYERLDRLKGHISYFISDKGVSFEDDLIKSKFGDLLLLGNMEDNAIEMEIAFRNLLEETLALNDLGEVRDDTSKTVRLLKFSIKFGLCYYSYSYISKIPFLLIEDLLTRLSINHAERIWNLIESFTDELTRPELFEKGQFVILRACKPLLKKLGKSCNAKFCGRVKLFLASIFPITERSAVNLHGKVNTGNLTSFEPEDLFYSHINIANHHNNGNNNSPEAQIVESGHDQMQPRISTDSTTTDTAIETAGSQASQQLTPSEVPSSEPAPMEVEGGIITEDGGGVAAGEASGSAAMAVEGVGEGGGSTIASALEPMSVTPAVTPAGTPAVTVSEPEKDYELYRTLWSLQSTFAADIKPPATAPPPSTLISITGATSTPAPSPAAVAAEASWSGFLSQVLRVLHYFESHPFPASELLQARARFQLARSQAGHSTASSKGEAPKEGDESASGNMEVEGEVGSAGQADQEGSSGRSSALFMGCKYLTSPQLFELELKDPNFRQQLGAQILIYLHTLRHRPQIPYVPPDSVMLPLESRVWNMIEQTPAGDQFCVTLRSLLGRELRWIAWKQLHCPKFERPADTLVLPTPVGESSADAGTSTSQGNSSKKRRRQTEVDSQKLLTTLEAAATSFFCNVEEDRIRQTLQSMAKGVPTFDEHIKEFEEAEDPDNGIEPDYHPRNNSVYCWRAMRLLAEKKLVVFADMYDGDLSKGLKKLKALAAGTEKESVVGTVLQQQPQTSKKVVSEGLPAGGVATDGTEGGSGKTGDTESPSAGSVVLEESGALGSVSVLKATTALEDGEEGEEAEGPSSVSQVDVSGASGAVVTAVVTAPMNGGLEDGEEGEELSPNSPADKEGELAVAPEATDAESKIAT